MEFLGGEIAVVVEFGHELPWGFEGWGLGLHGQELQEFNGFDRVGCF